MNKILTILITLMGILSGHSGTLESRQEPLQPVSDSTRVNTPIYFLDSVEVSPQKIHTLFKENKIEYVEHENDPVKAIKTYGEKARFGIFIFKTKQADK